MAPHTIASLLTLLFPAATILPDTLEMELNDCTTVGELPHLESVLLPRPFFWLYISTCHLSLWGLRIFYEWRTLFSFYTSPLHPLWVKMQRQKSKANDWQLLALSNAIFQDVPQIPPCCQAHTILWELSLGGLPHWGMLSAQNKNKCLANIFSGSLFTVCLVFHNAVWKSNPFVEANLLSRLGKYNQDRWLCFLILAQLQVWNVFVMGLLLKTPLKNLSLGWHDAISSQGLRKLRAEKWPCPLHTSVLCACFTMSLGTVQLLREVSFFGFFQYSAA